MKISVDNQNILLVGKPVGFTPLQVIKVLQKERTNLSNKKIGYAGRLDPMAEGLLILLIGEENKKRKEYEDLPKTYQFSLLLGVATDTYDILGKITEGPLLGRTYSKQQIEKASALLIGKKTVEYPPYSSAVYNGRPLYFWARKGMLSEITIPKRDREIFSLNILHTKSWSAQKLNEYVFSRIERVDGDFRQEEILSDWKSLLGEQNDNFVVVDFVIKCSSGTYIRSVCSEIGKSLGTCGIALTIKRTQIGTYNLTDALSVKM